MARRFHHDDGFEVDEGELNLTPYLDIITTLVIFMIFTFQVVIEFRMIDVFTPAYSAEASSQPSTGEEKVSVSLMVSKDAHHLVASGGVGYRKVEKKGEKYDYVELKSALKEWKGQYGLGESIVVTADADVEYTHVVETMDAIRRDGISP